MAYSFKNQPTATAQIERYVEGANGTTFKLAGINGEQTDAGNFRTAIADFIGIGGIAIAQSNSALQRNLNQAVQSDEQGEELELYIEPNTFTIQELNASSIGSSTRTIELEFGSRITAIKTSDFPTSTSFTGQKPADTVLTVDKSSGKIRISASSRSNDYTIGTDSATMTFRVPSITIDNVKYKATTATIKITGGIASEFVNI